MKDIQIVVNDKVERKISLMQYPVDGEPSRIGIQYDERIYVIVFDKVVRVEVYDLDSKGELNNRIISYHLPNKPATKLYGKRAHAVCFDDFAFNFPPTKK